MTLFKQIIIILSVLLAIIFASVMWLNFNNSKIYIQQQAYTDALHTANSLGLAISTVASKSDVSTAETMINSVFDSGYYEKIILTDMNKKILVSKKEKVSVAGVPNWFIDNINLTSPIASSQIMLGWEPYGILSVQLNSGYAYMQIWTIFKEILSMFIIVSLIAFFVLHLTLKIVLKPLRKVRAQAEAILDNDFIIQDEIPFTTELKNVVNAMNSMVRKVKEIFDKEVTEARKYHELMYYDEDVNIFNRRYLNIKLQEYLDSEGKNSQGVLVLISLNNLNDIKNEIGYKNGELFIREIASSVEQSICHNFEYIAAKVGAEDFAILAPTTSEEELDILCKKIIGFTEKIIKSFKLDEARYFTNIGHCKYYIDSSVKELFSKADFALATSKSKGAYKIEKYANLDEDSCMILGKEAWIKELQSAIDEDKFKLVYQNVVNIDNTSEVFQSELFLRLEEENDCFYNAGYFMPMAEELKFVSKIDHFVIDKVTQISSKETSTCRSFCINLGANIFLQSDDFAKLEDSIIKFKQISKCKLYFEIKSSNIPNNILSKFSKFLKELGFGLGLDSFILDSKSLISMQEIKPTYIKIHALYLLDLIDENNISLPGKSLRIIADSIDVKIIASHVENSKQKEKLQNIGIKYIQGNFVGNPKNLG